MTAAETFPKKEHLVKAKEFRIVYNKGVSFKKGPFILYRLQNDTGVNRLGLSISSRNIKRATKRNRVKRLFREAYRKTHKLTKQGFDLVLIVKKEPREHFFYKDAEIAFLNLLKEARLV
jgi:ribonuclease P protein component